MCKRSVQVIPELLRKINKYEIELGYGKNFDVVGGFLIGGDSMVNWDIIESEIKKLKVF